MTTSGCFSRGSASPIAESVDNPLEETAWIKSPMPCCNGPPDTRFYVLFPLRSNVPEPEMATYLADIKRRGFGRIFQDGKVFEYSQPESLLDVDFKKTAFVLVDRLKVAADIRQRLIDSIEICFRESGGEVLLEIPGGQRHRFSEAFECKTCGIRYEDPEPRLFSFNNPFGACSRCQGFGNTIDLDLNLVLPDRALSLNQGAIEPWTKPRYRVYLNDFKKSAKAAGVPLDKPIRELNAEHLEFTLNAVRDFFNYLETKKYKLHVRVFLSRYRGYTVCPDCRGSRLRQEARNIYVAGKNIADVCRMTIREGSEFFSVCRIDRNSKGNCGTNPLGDPFPTSFPERRRAPIPHAGPPVFDAVGRRGTAHSARDVAGLVAGRRALCARRTLDRASPARRATSH